MSERECEARRPERGDGPCSGPPDFDVQYLSTATGRVLDTTPACQVHGEAEMRRHAAAGGVGPTQMVPALGSPED